MSSATTSGVPPEVAIRSTIASSSAGTVPPPSSIQRRIESAAPLRIERPSRSMPLIRVSAVNGTSVPSPSVALAEAVALLREHDDRAALGRLVGEARELRGVGELVLVDARQREELGRLPVAERDRARLVEQERRAVARGLDRAAGEREHVAAHEPVHARRSRSPRAAPPIVVGIRQTSSATSTITSCSAPE